MKVILLGCGALGSNLACNLMADDLDIKLDVVDYDKVENRNIQAGTQFFLLEQIGMSKVEALQYNVYKWFGKEINIHEVKLTNGIVGPWDLIIDAFDNYESRKIAKRWAEETNQECIHLGFSPQRTFEVTWNENYVVPRQGRVEVDICEMRGARSFITHAAGIASSIIRDFLLSSVKKEVIGNAYTSRLII